ncbi:glycosyltransferase [Algoriphagus sp.]|uniref:glycosyltransferase n=1 Tax=Algoriphagus sp. TaxID=1872435 RepID=UPI002623DB0D|nr:glycosyltransferase [Algoriphagus sp.]
MKSPLISIALCTYNGMPYVEELVNSLLGQTYRPLEICIRDDQSSDGTWKLIQDYQKNYPQVIKAIRNPIRLGFQANFEVNFKDCIGDWIAPCDQDDIWRADKLELMMERAASASLIYHDSLLIDSEGNSLNSSISDKFRLVQECDPLNFLFFNSVSGHSLIFRRSLLAYASPFPKVGYYDHWLAYIASVYGQIQVIPTPLVCFRQHQSNQSDFQKKRAYSTNYTTSRQKMQQETGWLFSCLAKIADQKDASLVGKILDLAKIRETRFFIPALGWVIWKNRNRLMAIKPGNTLSQLAFAWRYCIGLKTKQLIQLG